MRGWRSTQRSRTRAPASRFGLSTTPNPNPNPNPSPSPNPNPNPEDSANRVSRAQIDALFAFSDELAHDYTGLWTSASTLAITLTNDTCCTHARLGDTMFRVRVRV